MKIIIDAFQYSHTVTGTDRMAYNFLRELQKIDHGNSYFILCSREKYTLSTVNSVNFKVIKPPAICSLPVLERYFSYLWRRLTKLRLISLKADVYYSFHNMALPGRRVARKMIASNLDLIPIILEEYKKLGKKTVQEQKNEYLRVAHLADSFVSISEYSRNELAKNVGVPKSKIDVVYLAADDRFSTNETMHTSGSIKNFPKRYIFTLGGSEPRKNVTKVIEAYCLLEEDMQDKYKLVIAGSKWHGKSLDMADNKNILNLGYFKDENLPKIYKEASAFVFASIYEGFGFTVLEAMASGVPVINARGTSLDEVAGAATLAFNPDDAKELSDKIKLLLGSKDLQKKLVKLGYQQSKKFSWTKSGKKLHEILTST